MAAVTGRTWVCDVTGSFSARVAARSAEVYADFLLPDLDAGMTLLDAGCGSGEITVGLARHVKTVVGVDAEGGFEDCVRHLEQAGQDNVILEIGDLYRLGYPDGYFDACLCHSVLEALEEPLVALGELERVLKPGAILAVASVAYSGIILSGGDASLLKRFYAVREELWKREGIANPYLGGELRGLLNSAGFGDIVATTKCIAYGTPTSVRAFGLDRAADCEDPWYRESAIAQGLATEHDLAAMMRAWRRWSESPDAYLAFPWCRATGRKRGRA